ncbi:MAG: hypothetical protein NT162_03525 [Candidatus Woesebacteria bacterium]|nr:hypothetical protein [Candidatus Woesebacteria bacterium]
MRKELVWVAIIGISFGLIIAFGVWRINSSLNKSKPGGPLATPSSVNPEAEFKITLNTPENDSVVTVTPVTVSGITKPLTWMVVSGETGDYILQSDEKGIFNQDVGLSPGVNQIKFTAFDSTGTQSVQKVLVVYSSAFQLNTSTLSTPNDAATGDAAIREKVAQKVAAAMNQPKAYLGVVTDITSSTIQIKSPEAQIEQISIGNDGIAVVNTTGTVNKTVKLTDIAIGDFITAMGYVDGNRVLVGQRILITDPVEDPALSVSMGKVTKTSTKALTVSDVKNGETGTLTPSKNTVIASFANGKTNTIKISGVKVDNLVIYVTDASGTTSFIRSVFSI